MIMVAVFALVSMLAGRVGAASSTSRSPLGPVKPDTCEDTPDTRLDQGIQSSRSIPVVPAGIRVRPVGRCPTTARALRA